MTLINFEGHDYEIPDAVLTNGLNGGNKYESRFTDKNGIERIVYWDCLTHTDDCAGKDNNCMCTNCIDDESNACDWGSYVVIES